MEMPTGECHETLMMMISPHWFRYDNGLVPSGGWTDRIVHKSCLATAKNNLEHSLDYKNVITPGIIYTHFENLFSNTLVALLSLCVVKPLVSLFTPSIKDTDRILVYFLHHVNPASLAYTLCIHDTHHFCPQCMQSLLTRCRPWLNFILPLFLLTKSLLPPMLIKHEQIHMLPGIIWYWA